MGILQALRSKYPQSRSSYLFAHSRPVRRRHAPASGHIGNLTYSWGTSSVTATEFQKLHLETIRARSREQYENNPHLRRWIQLLKNNVIGPRGIRLQARSVDLKGKLDKDANLAIEKGWAEWSREVDMGGRLTLRAAGDLFIASASNDGEVFIQKHLTPDGYGFKIDFLDPHMLSTTINDIARNGNRIVMGIELDRFNKAVAYYFPDTETVKGESYYSSMSGRQHKRVPAESIIHAFIQERVEQLRGVPWASNALLRMKMLDGYTESELANAEGQSNKMMFMKQTEQAAVDPLHDATDEDGTPIEELEPGLIEYLPYGWEPFAYNPTSPNANFNEFNTALLMQVAASLGVSHHSLTTNLKGVNYTSSRTGGLEDRRAWEGLQEWAIEKFYHPLFESWLNPALASGLLLLPGHNVALNPLWEPKYRTVRWQGPRWEWVDPQKQMAANEAAVRLKISSRAEIIRGRGRDPEEVWSEIEAEDKRFGTEGEGVTAPSNNSPSDGMG